jgi:hypothetical protein
MSPHFKVARANSNFKILKHMQRFQVAEIILDGLPTDIADPT